MVKAYAHDLRDLLEEADFTERKAFLRSFIKRIEVNKEQVTVSYDLPVPQDSRAKEQTQVLSIVTTGGDRGIRTPNLCDANAALSQLSYIPTDSILANPEFQGQARFSPDRQAGPEGCRRRRGGRSRRDKPPWGHEDN